MTTHRPAFLLASLAATVPAVVYAETAAPVGHDRALGPTPEWLGGTSLGSLAIPLALLLLLGGAALLASGRISWRLGAIAIVGGCALLGGDAILEGAWTAIAVSP